MPICGSSEAGAAQMGRGCYLRPRGETKIMHSNTTEQENEELYALPVLNVLTILSCVESNKALNTLISD